ncbi:uncharacterized mitochondrial protein-like protein [Tanacetum coccineum]
MKQPPSYDSATHPVYVCRLRKALYGLRQAPRAWYHRFAMYISSLGFHSSKSDNSLFTFHRGPKTIYLLLYVDDIILTVSSPAMVVKVISCLSTEFAMKDLGQLSYFLGIVVNRTSSGLFLSQSSFAREILIRANILAGSLQYLTFSRPDIAYAIQQVCLHMHDPREPHMDALKRILRYLKGTLSQGLFIRPSSIDRLVCYSDADWAHCPDTRRSTSGLCVFLGDNFVPWSSKRQHVVSRSSAEAKYKGVTNVVAEAAWLRNLLIDLHCPLSQSTIVFCDNRSLGRGRHWPRNKRSAAGKMNLHIQEVSSAYGLTSRRPASTHPYATALSAITHADKTTFSYDSNAASKEPHVPCFSTASATNFDSNHTVFDLPPPPLTAVNFGGAAVSAFPSLRALQENLQLPFFYSSVAPPQPPIHGDGGMCSYGNWLPSVSSAAETQKPGPTELDCIWSF